MAPATRSIALLHPVPAKIFPRFRSLPPELRLNIYRYIDLLTNDRNVHAQLRTKSVPATARLRYPGKSLTFRSLTPVPLVLHLNQESRKEYLKKYILCFKQADGRRRIFVNFTRNALLIRCSEKDFQRYQIWSILDNLTTDKASSDSPTTSDSDDYLPLLSRQLKVDLVRHKWQSLRTSSDGVNRNVRKVYEFLIQKKENPIWVLCPEGPLPPHQLEKEEEALKEDNLSLYLEKSIQMSSPREVPGTYKKNNNLRLCSPEKDVSQWDIGWERAAQGM